MLPKTFLPPIATDIMNHLLSGIGRLLLFCICGAIIGMLLARRFGGKSREVQEAIFTAAIFIGACIYVAFFLG